MNENGNDSRENENESNAARRLRATGGFEENTEEEPIKVNKLANFWYHNKVKIIVIAFFAFVIGIAVSQFASQSNPDVSILYAGPEYITANENQAFCDVLESLIEDLNGDGKIYVQLNDMVFMTDKQVEEYKKKCEENGDDMLLNMLENKQMNERFTNEVFGGEASICILSREQYESVARVGGFVKLSSLFDEVPDYAVDDYGILLSDLRLYKYYDKARIFPDDAVIAIRTISTMSAITGKKKAERLHSYSVELFKAIIDFEYPEGYTEDADADLQ